jgi:hypothetical protein
VAWEIKCGKLSCGSHVQVVPRVFQIEKFMAAIVQLVRTPDCGSGGRGFEPH